MKRVSERLRRHELEMGVVPAGPGIPLSRQPRVIVIGHKNPDTDSIAAAAGYAELKRMMGMTNTAAACAGLPSARTDFLFNRFKVEIPQVLSDVHPRIKDVLDDKPSTINA